jgi:hypothetical protein
MIDLRTKGRLQLLLVGVFFIGPFLLAYVLFVSDSDWLPSAGIENGQLLDPPRLLPDTVLIPGSDTDEPKFRGKWSLIIIGRAQCTVACVDALYETRQVRRALGRDDGRVQRVFFTGAGRPDSEFMEREHPTLIVVEFGSQAGRELAPVLGEHASGDILLADPLGNLIMRFPEGTGMEEMHKDLKHLLKISHIG